MRAMTADLRKRVHHARVIDLLEASAEPYLDRPLAIRAVVFTDRQSDHPT